MEENSVRSVAEWFTELWEANQDQVVAFGKALLLAILVIIITWIAKKMVRAIIEKSFNKFPNIDESIRRIIKNITSGLISFLAFIIILDLFGINTSGILTIIGACGLAVGLAMKDTLSNIAAGVMLIGLRRYATGDYVDCGTAAGTIKRMGLFCTVLDTFDGIEISIPNSAILNNPIRNYSTNPLRRIDITVGISYTDSLDEGINVLLDLMKNNPKILQTPAPEVLVADLADSSVNLTLRLWTENANYWAVYWELKYQLKSTLESKGLNIPFPQRVITFANSIPEQK